jgi:hypothetical protein
MPWEVRAYRRLSILRLQLRHRKQAEQNAWSPVRIARSSILLLQALQLYVQLLQIKEPSPRSKRFASESRSVPQVWQRKQSRCHRLPASNECQLQFTSDQVLRVSGVLLRLREMGDVLEISRASLKTTSSGNHRKSDDVPSSKAFPSSRISPQPLHGNKSSLSIDWFSGKSSTAVVISAVDCALRKVHGGRRRVSSQEGFPVVRVDRRSPRLSVYVLNCCRKSKNKLVGNSITA